MSTAKLQLTYRPDDQWHGQLDATVTSGAFSGAGSAWVDRQHIKETFISALRAFPISAYEPPMIQGGFYSKEQRGTLDQCHLRVVIRPYAARGVVLLLTQVDLATEWWINSDTDQHQSVTVRFLTEYSAIDDFSPHLEAVLDGKRDIAVLVGR